MSHPRLVPKLLFVGAGNIAQSIMKGIIKACPTAAQQIMATAPSYRNLNFIQQHLGCKVGLLNSMTKTLHEFDPDLILICVKPQVLMASTSKRDSLTDLLRSIPNKCTTLSLLAGIRSRVISTGFDLPERNIVRLMLNTAAEINSTSVFYHAHDQIRPETLEAVQSLLKLIGHPVVKLNDETLMDVATGICGSGIAFFYEAIQAISDLSVKNGLTRADSIRVAAQLSKSAGEMLLYREAHPYQLRDDVASPAGTTIYGIHKWHEQSTNQAIANAFQASIDRARELSSISESEMTRLLSDRTPRNNN